MAGGNLGLGTPTPFLHPEAIARIATGNPVPARRAADLAAFARAKHVSTVVVDKSQAGMWSGALDRLAPRRDVGGVLLYRLSGAPRACPS